MLKNMKTVLFVSVLAATSLLASNSTDYTKGKQVFDKWCVHCHGIGMPATNALRIVYKETNISPVLEQRKDLDAEFVKFIVRHGRYSMPFFRKTEINDEQLKNLALYLSTKNKK
ncbi:cytochrome c [Malaciobacter molluscorum LMG 25693]|uniref:Cytochrome c n=2 Tax=Malaciobacter molluscorum LMG 25693 TaxID=870501 RepID=A0AB33GLY4_9BACT|nr:cytochrome c [Malaciobacter molluscorum]AXX92851.1 cytochrome c [Malaciobacter molluscorum LMG 25693]